MWSIDAHAAERRRKAVPWKGTFFAVYDPVKDGNGTAFEDLPDSWACPVCGAPKSAYTKSADGKWSHEH